MASTLHSASRTGNVNKILELLKKGADVNAQDEAHGQTALTYAAALGQMYAVKALLGNGADPNLTNMVGYSPLMAAARNCRHRCAMLLIDAGAEVDATDDWGYTALMLAANDGLPETVNMLLEHGANVNAAATGGYTSLMAATINNSIPENMVEEIVALLLSAGADVNATTEDGKSAATFALERGHEQRIRLFHATEQTAAGTGSSGAGFPGRTRA